MSAHVVPVRLYVGICAVLLALTWLTVTVASHDLGTMNTVVALGVAACKATLVVLYFMHARYSSRLVNVSIATGILFLGILLALTLADYLTRARLPLPGA
jgi:cytochrome c oxidase subunit 4